MFQITINEKGGQATSQSFDKNEITIGRVQGNDVVLPKGNISKRHSRIVLKDGKFIIVDLKSTNGTYVNGKKITAPQVIKGTDKIYIGDYTLQLSSGNGAASVAEASAPSSRPKSARNDEVDLFGGDASPDESGAPGASAKPGSPGLIDDNFDQEFDPPVEAPPAKATKAPTPSVVKAKGPAAQKVPEPEPPEPELDLDADSDGDEDDAPLDLGAGSDLMDQSPSDDSSDEEPDELSPPKAPVVQMPVKSPKKPAAAAPTPTTPVPSSRSVPGKKPAQPAPALQKSKSPTPEMEEEEDDDLFDEDDAPAPAPAPAPAAARSEPISSPRPAPTPMGHGPAAASAAAVAAVPAPVLSAPAKEHGPVVMHPSMPALAPALVPPSAAVERQPAIQAIHLAVVDELGLRSAELGNLVPFRERVIAAARGHAQRMQSSGRLNPAEDLDQIANEVASRAINVELIAPLYQDESVVQIVITHDRQVWAERDALKLEPDIVPTENQVLDLIRCLGVLGGASPGPESPLVDVRLRDGARVVAVLPPLAFRGPTLSIRKANREAYNLEAFVESGSLSEDMSRFIGLCVKNRKNMLLSLGPGVSGSATLNALASVLPEEDRIVSIECGVEIDVRNLRNVIALEPTPTAKLSALLRHAVAALPDHVILGAIDEPDAFDVVCAFAGPLEGSMAAIYASSTQEALDRLCQSIRETKRVELAVAQRMVASAFPIVIQETRFAERGLRRITAISEVVMEGEELQVHDIFLFRPEAIDDSGELGGTFAPTGQEPRFVQELAERGAQIDMDMFKE